MLQSAGRPLSRKELSQKLGISDRQVRRYKAQLLNEGYPIASTSHEAGYSYGNKELYLQSSRECYSRAAKEIRNGQLLEMAARALHENDTGQITLEEVMQI